MSAKKGYVHVLEYDLTKCIIDRTDIDIEDDYALESDMSALLYKTKQLILPPYDKFMDYENKGTIFRPFTNINHSSYLINLFEDLKDCSTVFDCTTGKDDKLDGRFIIHYADKKKKILKFFGIKNQSVLMTTLVLKALLGSDMFSKYMKNIFKIDTKLTERHTTSNK